MLNQIVKEIGDINLTGNLIPYTWFGHRLFRKDPKNPVSVKNRTNINAMLILSDIVYWYRPTIIRDETSGFITEIKQKFAGDKLQKSYKSWAIQFGLTTRQVKEACYFLKERELITIEYRHIKIDSGGVLLNVTFFEPVVENVKRITNITDAVKVGYDDTLEEPEDVIDEKSDINEEDIVRSSVRHHTLQRTTLYATTYDSVRSSVRHHTPQRTYTENNTKITTKSNTEIKTQNPTLAKKSQVGDMEQIPTFPKIELEVLKSKEDVYNAFGLLMEYALYAEKCMSYVNSKTIEEFKQNCKKDKHVRKHCSICKPATKNCKIHLKPCTCLSPNEIPAFKLILEAINILTNGTADYSKESMEASKFVRKLQKLKYPIPTVVGCIAWAYKKGKYDIFPMTISNIHKLMPEFLDKVRTGELKNSIELGDRKLSAGDKNWLEYQKNKEELLNNAAEEARKSADKYGIRELPKL